MRREAFGRVKDMGGRVAGCTRWEREGKTGSRNRTWVAPESARIGEGVIEHKMVRCTFAEPGWFGTASGVRVP